MSDQSLDFGASLELARQYVHQDIQDIFRLYRQRSQAKDSWSDWITERLETYCLRRGKAIRPWLVAVGAAASQDIPLQQALERPKVRRLMALIELTHYRLLLADDVADRDEQRHGFPSFHEEMHQWLQEQPQYQTVNTEVRVHTARSYTEIAGILLQQIATWQLHRSPVIFSGQELATINDIFDQHEYLATAGGWYRLFDQSFQALPDVSEGDFLQGLLLVTGHYTFIGPLQLGACLGNRSPDLEVATSEYGAAAGILFQVTDDWLGLFGDSQVTGKPVGNDVREGKKTLPFQEAYRQGTEVQRQQLTVALRNESLAEEEVLGIQQLVRELGGEKYSYDQAALLVKKGQAALKHWPHSETQTLLVHVLKYLEHRLS